MLVKVENFDEALCDLMRLIKGVDRKILDAFAFERRRWSTAPYPEGSRGWPVVRLNALPVLQTPTVCRRVVCRIGGLAEARDAVSLAEVDIPIARTRVGVLAFGGDADVRGPSSVMGSRSSTCTLSRLDAYGMSLESVVCCGMP